MHPVRALVVSASLAFLPAITVFADVIVHQVEARPPENPTTGYAPVNFNGSTTQTDPFAGNVYVAWETNDAAPTGVTVYNPNLIKLMSSSDGGQDFTYHLGLPQLYK